MCFSTSTVNGLYGVGGLIGYNFAVGPENCYSTGNVTGVSPVGGLIGSCGTYNSAINCYSTGVVTGTDYVGGLIGSGSAINSYFLEGRGPNNGIGTPLTDSQMKHCVNFSNWDFVDSYCTNGPDYIWFNFLDSIYPQFAWQWGICTVPNVIGMNMSDANDIIIESGFTVGTITYDHNDTFSEGFVINQEPNPGVNDCGLPVNYVVSLGVWPCEVPDIVGMTMSDANITITIYYGFTVGNISYAYSDTVTTGHVISQNPEPGPSECNLAINYVVSLGPLPCNGNFPDYDENGIVNFLDFAIFADAWLTVNPTINLTTGDNFVNIVDLKCFCNRWLEEEP